VLSAQPKPCIRKKLRAKNTFERLVLAKNSALKYQEGAAFVFSTPYFHEASFFKYGVFDHELSS
jgi:hypothetical protein